MQRKKILIATGIYPPAIGGPAEYAKNLKDLWSKQGHDVALRYFSLEHRLPTGLRHFFFFFKSFFAIKNSDFILALDTFSVGVPIALGCMIFKKDFVVRAGGDFLWEMYVERTKQKILFKDFYNNDRNFNLKEKIIFSLTRWVLQRAKTIIFSTSWQREVWNIPYRLSDKRTRVIENFYGKTLPPSAHDQMIFVGGVRQLVWKNTDTLSRVFNDNKIKERGIFLDLNTYKHDIFIKKIQDSYAVILVSLGDISPNMILESIMHGKPFIVTKEIGIYDRIKNMALFVDPLDEEDIKAKILWLADEHNYKLQVEKIQQFTFVHSWNDIAQEILQIQ